MISTVFDKLLTGESTAQAIARSLAKRGVRKEKICIQDLQPYYQAMTITKDTAMGVKSSISGYVSDIIPSKDPICAVIVETRQHPLLEYVVYQFAQKLNISIQIFHGLENRLFIKDSKIGDLINTGQVQLTNMGVSDFSLRHYNSLMLSRSFWESLCGRGKVLVFQTDSILCDRSSYTINDFMQFDYVGSNWNRNRPIGMVIDGGSGGLSLRDWDLTMECLERFPPHLWPGGEDAYFAFHFDLLGGNIARDEDCGKFSTQSDFVSRSFGGHQIQNLRELALKKFLEYCPEARFIMNKTTN